MNNKKVETEKLFEYRIRYNAEEKKSALDNYHYYMAHNAQEAMDFHNSMLKSHNIRVQTLSIEKFNPYSEKWELKTDDYN